MRTLIARAWRNQRFADVVDALNAASLVGIEPSILITDDAALFEALIDRCLTPAELFKGNWYKRADRADAFIAVQMQDCRDMGVEACIDYAIRHHITTAVWRV